MTPPKQQLVQALAEAGLPVDRMIDCQEGSKAPKNHNQQAPEEIGGNYGVYATARDRLVVLDVDDYDDIEDDSGLKALANLPATFQTESPHGGTHHYYRVNASAGGRLIAAVLEDTFGTNNPNPSWGEVRTANQYVVGPGSQLDGCGKEWCSECADPDGGTYDIAEDTGIATIEADTLVETLRVDPQLTTTNVSGSRGPDPGAPDVDEEEILEHALDANENFRRLWNGDYSQYGDRSTAESALAAHLAFWFQGDKETVRRMMDRAATKKWADRPDSSYRESILEAVDEVDEYYDPDAGRSDPADFDPAELDRAEAILESQTAPDNPAGDLEEKNGCYGYEIVRRNEAGEIVDTEWKSVTNFTLETIRYLDTYDGEVLAVRVIPQHAQEDPFEVQVEPTVFNEPRTFREQIVRGRTTRFEPQGRPTAEILGDLRETVGSQPAPRQEATEFIGLHDGEEWVTPAGTITPDGWADEPTHTFFEKGGSGDGETDSSLAEKWQLLPDRGNDYDESEVRAICEKVPQLRRPARGLPVIGWFYAAPLKVYIQDWEGQFNLLQVTGGTGAGKTNFLGVCQQLFGGNSEPYGCGDTHFTIQKKLSSSCGFPVWFDEYKPADLGDRQLDWLHRQFRKLTAEQAVSKGRSDLSELTFKMRAPAVFSGEQWVQDAAARRRTVMTNLPQPGDAQRRIFSEVVGKTYETPDEETRYPEGLDLHEHALAYYRYICGLDEAQLREAWYDARDRTAERLQALRAGNIEDTEFQGLQTIEFGIEIFRRFAREHGVDEAALPGDEELRAAYDHVVENIGPGGRRREHIDEFLELVTQAANAGYLDEGVTHRVVDSRNYGQEVLALHMPSVFAKVKRYVGDHNLDDYTLLGKADYMDTLRDKAETEGTYALEVNQRVRGLENGSKAVFLDPEEAAEVLGDDFHLAAFRSADEAAAATDDSGVTPLSGLDPALTATAVEATVKATLDPKPWLSAEGTLEGETAMVNYVGRGTLETTLQEGQTYHIENAVPATDDDGELHLEFRQGVTEFTEIEEAGGDQTDLPEAAETDGGLRGLKKRVLDVLREAQEPVSASEVAGELGEDSEAVKDRLGDLKTAGRVIAAEGGYET